MTIKQIKWTSTQHTFVLLYFLKKFLTLNIKHTNFISMRYFICNIIFFLPRKERWLTPKEHAGREKKG